MEGPHKQDRGGPAGTESDPRREVGKETGPPSCSSWGQNPAADPTCGGGIPPPELQLQPERGPRDPARRPASPPAPLTPGTVNPSPGGVGSR